MEKYLNMKEQFGLPVYSLKRSQVSTKLVDCDGYEIESFYNSEHAEYTAHAINSHDELVSEVERLRGALHDAATSLETIHIRSFGEESLLDSKPQMRSFAGARAKVAREALAE